MLLLRKISFWLAVTGLTALVVFAVRVHLRQNAALPAPPIAPPPRPFAHGGVAASGIVEASGENTRVGVPVNGLVAKILVHSWDCVKAGQPLLQLDDRDLRAQLVLERANIKVAEATAARFRDQLARLKSVSDMRAVSADDVKTRENDVTVAEVQIEAAQAAVDRTQLLLDRLTVTAPIAGTVLQVNVRAGEYISTNETKAPVVLGDISKVQIRADVDEQLAPRVKKGKNAVGYLKGDTTHPIEMSFVRIEPFVVPKLSLTGSNIERADTRVLQVIFALNNTTEHPVYVGQQIDLYIAE